MHVHGKREVDWGSNLSPLTRRTIGQRHLFGSLQRVDAATRSRTKARGAQPIVRFTVNTPRPTTTNEMQRVQEGFNLTFPPRFSLSHHGPPSALECPFHHHPQRVKYPQVSQSPVLESVASKRRDVASGASSCAAVPERDRLRDLGVSVVPSCCVGGETGGEREVTLRPTLLCPFTACCPCFESSFSSWWRGGRGWDSFFFGTKYVASHMPFSIAMSISISPEISERPACRFCRLFGCELGTGVTQM